MAKIDDVAKLAEVSKGTVSNVFSRKRPISKEVQEKVLRAAKQLNYTPNHIARSLVTKKTMTIGLKIPYSKNSSLSNFHINLINGVVTAASSRNYRVLIDTIIHENTGLSNITTDPIDGVIILDPAEEDKRISFLYQLGTPFVVVGKPQNSDIKENLSYVDNNNEEIAFEVCRLLIQKGHRNILFLNAPETRTVSQDRRRGFLRAFHENGLPIEEHFHHYKPNIMDDPRKYGYESTLKCFADDSEVSYTAIITDVDKVALGVLRALKELGRTVPDDVSLIALSDDLSLAHELETQLTTVDLQASRLGAEAVKLLFEKMEDKNKQLNHRIIVPAQINEGESVRDLTDTLNV